MPSVRGLRGSELPAKIHAKQAALHLELVSRAEGDAVQPWQIPVSRVWWESRNTAEGMASSISGGGVPPPSSAQRTQKLRDIGGSSVSHTPSRLGAREPGHGAERPQGASSSGYLSRQRRGDAGATSLAGDEIADSAHAGRNESSARQGEVGRSNYLSTRTNVDAQETWLDSSRGRYTSTASLRATAPQQRLVGQAPGAGTLGERQAQASTRGFTLGQAWPLSGPQETQNKRHRADGGSGRGLLLHPVLVALIAIAVGGVLMSVVPHTVTAPVLRSLGLASSKPLSQSELHRLVEELQKKHSNLATKIQVQVDVLAKKLDKTDENQQQLRQQVQQEHEAVKQQLEKLGSQVGGVDKALKELLVQGSPILRQQVLELVQELKAKSAAAGDVPVTLDDVRKAAREIVEMELQTHSADGIGREDFALASLGTKVVRHSFAVRPPDFINPLSMMARQALRLPALHPDAQQVLQPRFGTPGSCLPLSGESGFVELMLRQGVRISAVSVEHIDKAVALDVSSAPREFRVFGASSPSLAKSSWLTGAPSGHQLDRLQWQWLGDGLYSTQGPPVQTFPVSHPLQSGVRAEPSSGHTAALSSGPAASFNFLRFLFLSNHGHPNFTCLYRLRVHGQAVDLPEHHSAPRDAVAGGDVPRREQAEHHESPQL